MYLNICLRFRATSFLNAMLKQSSNLHKSKDVSVDFSAMEHNIVWYLVNSIAVEKLLELQEKVAD